MQSMLNWKRNRWVKSHFNSLMPMALKDPTYKKVQNPHSMLKIPKSLISLLYNNNRCIYPCWIGALYFPLFYFLSDSSDCCQIWHGIVAPFLLGWAKSIQNWNQSWKKCFDQLHLLSHKQLINNLIKLQ